MEVEYKFKTPLMKIVGPLAKKNFVKRSVQGICENTIGIKNLSGRLTSYQGGKEADFPSTKDLAFI